MYHMKQIHPTRFEQIFFCAGCLLAVAGIIVLVLASLNDSIWSDEAFSIRLTQLPFTQMISLTARDVHPPLYYLSLRFFSGVLRMLIPSLSVVMAAKLHSVGYVLLLAILLAVKLRKAQGMLVAGLSLALLFLSSSFLSYGIEIRMYTMAAFFVTGAAISACSLLHINAMTMRPYLPLVFWTLAASYTNYYACIAVFFLWLYLFGILCIRRIRTSKRDTDCMKPLFAFFYSSGLTVLLYLPWLVIAFRQFREISGNESYWIEPLSRYTIVSWLLFVFNNYPLLFLCMTLILTSVVISFISKDRSEQEHVRDAFLYGTGIVGTGLFGLTISLLFRPVFFERYLLPAFPAMWIGIAMIFILMINRLKTVSVSLSQILCGICLAACAFICIDNMRSFSASESWLAQETRKLHAFYETLDERDIIVTTNSHLNVNFSFLTDCQCNIFDYTESEIFIEAFPSIRNMTDTAEADTWFTESRRVFFLETDTDTLLRANEVFPRNSYRTELRGNYFMEGNLSVYEVFLRR